MRHVFILISAMLLLAACRFIGPASPSVTAARPDLFSNGAPDPNRQPSTVPSRKCVVDCGPRSVCNEQSGECEEKLQPGLSARDGGPAWLP